MTESRTTHPRIRPRRGAARASTWWGKAWVRACEESAYGEAELRAARSLARSGAVGAISVSSGRYLAAVEDGDELWSASTELPVLGEAERAAFVEAVAAEAGRLPALLAGDLPHALIEHAEEAGVELLPYGGELSSSCTCVAWLDPCAHALAVGYQVAWLADADPFVLLALRGLPREELLARLHERQEIREERPGDVALAADAAARAQRILELLETDADVGHLI
ncbi:MAG: hypothetical protein ABIO16_16985 [Nocardioides sp.]